MASSERSRGYPPGKGKSPAFSYQIFVLGETETEGGGRPDVVIPARPCGRNTLITLTFASETGTEMSSFVVMGRHSPGKPRTSTNGSPVPAHPRGPGLPFLRIHHVKERFMEKNKHRTYAFPRPLSRADGDHFASKLVPVSALGRCWFLGGRGAKTSPSGDVRFRG